jgi:hypothetical protein
MFISEQYTEVSNIYFFWHFVSHGTKYHPKDISLSDHKKLFRNL